MRLRLARLFENSSLVSQVHRPKVEMKLGVSVPCVYGSGRPRWLAFFQECELRDLLDMVSYVAQTGLVTNTAYRGAAKQWIDDVRTIFREENVRYRVDDFGVVHFSVDGEFEHNVSSALSALTASRYTAARMHFDAGQRALDNVPPQTREAIRQTYEAIETVFRLMFPEVARLNVGDVEKKLSPLVLEAVDGTERDCIKGVIAAFKDWIVGAQGYRHGKGTENLDNPSISTAVLIVSVGAAFLRWLVEVDRGRDAQKDQTVEGA